MSAQPVDIQIFGRSLRVNCPPDQRDALNQAADDPEPTVARSERTH
ncbi:hypothetical protein DMI70_20765 [Escherichia coli]|nr:hypothetical protein [Escherichia coli]